MKEGEPKPKPESEPGKRKEFSEVFCTCSYCQDRKYGLHKVETIDGKTEWLCGRHKRRADLTGLASYDLREPTEKDHKQADYIRDIIVKLPAVILNPASDEAKERLYSEKILVWGILDLPPEHRRARIITVESYNAALVDVMDAYEEGVKGFEDRVSVMKLDYRELSEIEDVYETQDRNNQIDGYNNGLQAGLKALTARGGGDAYDGMGK